jgi:CRP/FNR family transcriptional regulator, cyclic AMP receptor protein
MSLIHALGRIPIFTGLDAHDLEELEASLVLRRYSRGQVMFHKGDEGGNLYMLRSGRVKVAIPSPQGEEVILAILSAGEILGELSLIDGKPRSATVEALEDTEALCLRREDFMRFLSTRFDAVQRVLEVLSGRLRDTDSLLAETHFLDTTSRIAKKMLYLGKVFGVEEQGRTRIGVRITQRDLASMVGATRESVNKQIRWFREHGIVQFEDGYLTILDPVRLARRARFDPNAEGRG